jgi:hypothetical protein
MTIAILSWVHNQKSIMDTILNRTNMGHSSMEITISKNKFREIVKRNSFFKEYHKIMNNYNKIYDEIFKIIENMVYDREQIKKDTEEYIKSANYAIKRKLPIDVLEKCYELQALQGKYDKFKSYSAFMPKAVYNGKQKNISIYFSFWPEEENNEASQQSSLTKRRKVFFNFIKKEKMESNTLGDDLDLETDGIDLENIFYDFRKENLEQVAIIPRNPDKDSKSWDKKDKIIYKVLWTPFELTHD